MTYSCHWIFIMCRLIFKTTRGARQKCAGARGRFSHAQEWSTRPDKLETSASFVGPDVRRWHPWMVCCSILCSCALMWMLGCCVCEKQAVLVLAVRGCVCKRVAVEQPIPCGALMCHVRGAACGPDLYAPPRALPNVRERGTLPTDGALHVRNPGRTPPAAIAAAARFGMARPRVWEVQGCATVLRATQWAAL